MEIQKIEHYAVRKITEASIVDNQSLAGVDHLYLVSNDSSTRINCAYLDIVQVLFVHGLELRDAGRDTVQVMLHGIF